MLLNKSLLLGLCMAAMAPAHGALAANPPAYVADTIADPGRPPGDLAQDGERKPADVLAFAGVKPNQVVVDFFARGYYTRLLAKLVGPKGKVYALTPMIVAFPDLEALIAENKQRVRDGKPGVVNPVDPLLAIQNIAEYSNVTAMMEMLRQYGGQFALPEQVDAVVMADGYRALHGKDFGTEATVPGIDKQIFAALKNGGTFTVSDVMPSAADKDSAKAEILAAGFVLDAESPLFDGASRVLWRFKKPANAANTDKRPGKGAMDGYFGNTSVMNKGLMEAPPREERRHFYHPDGSYQEFGLTNVKFPDRGDQFQEGQWFWDVAGHNCMLHQFPVEERGFVVCHAAAPFKKAGDHWSELRNGNPPATELEMLPGLQPLSDPPRAGAR